MNLKPGAHIHLMGICGTAMASLAGLLKARGFVITGSDQNPYPPMSTQLEKLGIPVQAGYRAENLKGDIDLVIVGNVISKNNPEAEEMLRKGLAYTSLPKAMGDFVIENRESIVISGTHGKTTTTSLIAWLAKTTGQKFGYLVGGIPKNFSLSFQLPEGPYFIIEGDEYDTAYFDKVPKFVHYKPKHVILTSIEFDHADIYKDLDHVKSAFKKLLELIPQDGTLIVNAEDPNCQSLLGFCKAKNLRTLGKDKGDYQIHNLKHGAESVSFDLQFGSQGLGSFTVPMSGEYNAFNAASGLALAHVLGWDLSLAREGLKTFQGVKRRQEILGEPGGVLVIEDFAHHPTAVKLTLEGIKARYPERKIWAVFEPRSATSRRKVFQKDYAISFKSASKVLIAQAYDQSKIQDDERFSSEELVSDIERSGIPARCEPNADAIVSCLTSEAKKGDVVLIMSNGGFEGIYGKLMKSLEGRR